MFAKLATFCAVIAALSQVALTSPIAESSDAVNSAVPTSVVDVSSAVILSTDISSADVVSQTIDISSSAPTVDPTSAIPDPPTGNISSILVSPTGVPSALPIPTGNTSFPDPSAAPDGVRPSFHHRPSGLSALHHSGSRTFTPVSVPTGSGAFIGGGGPEGGFHGHGHGSSFPSGLPRSGSFDPSGFRTRTRSASAVDPSDPASAVPTIVSADPTIIASSVSAVETETASDSIVPTVVASSASADPSVTASEAVSSVVTTAASSADPSASEVVSSIVSATPTDIVDSTSVSASATASA